MLRNDASRGCCSYCSNASVIARLALSHLSNPAAGKNTKLETVYQVKLNNRRLWKHPSGKSARDGKCVLGVELMGLKKPKVRLVGLHGKRQNDYGAINILR